MPIILVWNRSFVPNLFLTRLKLVTIGACNTWWYHIKGRMNSRMQNDKNNQTFYECEVQGYILRQLEFRILFWLHSFPNRDLLVVGTKVAAPTNVWLFLPSSLMMIQLFWNGFVSIFGCPLVFFCQLNGCRVSIWNFVPTLLLG